MAKFMAYFLLIAAALVRPLPAILDPAKPMEPSSQLQLDGREAGNVIYFDAPLHGGSAATFLR